MSAKKLPLSDNKNALNQHLKNFVSFGEPASQPNSSQCVNGRLKELVRKVEDLNRRVDRIKNRF